MFRRHGGVKSILTSLEVALARKAPPKDADGAVADEENQVVEVQRIEGVRLALELLTWAQGDKDGITSFDVCPPHLAYKDSL